MSLVLSVPSTFGLELPMVDQLDRDLLRAVDDMRVGQDQAVGADDEAGALGVHGLGLLCWMRHLTEELREGIVVIVAESPPKGVANLLLGRDLHLAFDGDADHRVAILRHDGAVIRRRSERNRLRGIGGRGRAHHRCPPPARS